ncbi:hypothetical protein ANN_07387 [Periplaneta americana]|uniref:Uncharacterized protein n=1 Tax=Periplaneta americana TaxID=6978 RepID=A0ABQ8T028_PERAM|nr:hypothetical protein ANN_07387 [Periplaneta americana]
MANLTEEQRIEIGLLIIMIGYGDRRKNQEEISKILRKFNETGSVKNKPKSGRPKQITDCEKALDTVLAVE